MSIADLAIVGGSVVTDHVAPATVLIQGGRILALQAPDAAVNAQRVIDAAGMLVIPGVIDIHVHCRDPSYPHRGDFATESRAAAAGGVTTIFEMPISKPGTATSERWRHRRDLAAAKSVVNVALYGAPSLLDAPDLERMVEDGAIGFKLFLTRAAPGREDEFEGLTTDDVAHVLRVLETIRAFGLPCVVHAEDQSLLDLYRDRARASGVTDHTRHQASRPAVVEAASIATLVHLSLATGARVHVAHVSSAAGLEAVRHGKRLGAPISAETCPHYLFCTEDDLARAGAFGVINPPIRFASDRDALWGGIADGTIDLVSTDHAPFSRAEKEAVTDLLDSPPGHPGLQTLLPLMLNAALEGRLSVPKVVDLLCTTPARLFGLHPRKGTLDAGADADVTIYDPRVRRTIRNGEGEGRAADCNVLFDGMDVQGHVHATIVHGAVVYEQGEITARPGAGRIVRPHGRKGDEA